jgi:PKD repeat protein
MMMGRNTVVPDGVMNWYDAPMPQALVTFDLTGASVPMAQVPGLTGLWKSDLLGYGVDANGHYLSPYYLVEVPSSYYIPPYGYDWDSWMWDCSDRNGPYEFWGDLMVKSYADQEPSLENIMDVEVYSDNHGIAAMTAVALDTEGTITVTATADFPDRFLKGKYGPTTSDDIDIQWGVVEFDPDFEGVPRVCEEVEGCSVEFVNLTTGATKPYKHATWDFGDGTAPVVDQAIQNGQKVTHNYAKAGIFDVTLTMTDANDVVAYQIEFDYITVGEGGAGNAATWDFSGPGCFPKHLPDSFFGSVQLGSLTDVPPAVQGVYYNDAGTWTFWAPDAPGTTLATLVGGLSADYLVCVTGVSSWDIPLP